MQIAIITDTHFGIKNDAQYILDYQEKFYKNIFFPFLDKEKIKHVFHLGDLFDRRKYINFVTLNKTKQMFLDELAFRGANMFIIPGNHDVYFKNSNDIGSLTELLGQYKNVCVIDKPYDLEYDGTTFSFIPWINSENYASSMQYIANSNADILCGHLELQGFEMYAGVSNNHGMESVAFSKFKEVWSGHFHHKSTKDNIKYLGAPMEFTFADCNDPRGFHVFDTETKSLTFIQNSYTLYEKLYYNDESIESGQYYKDFDTSTLEGKIVKLYVSRKTKPALFEFFVDKLYKQNLTDLTIMEDFSEFAEQNIDLEIKEQSTKELMDKYVDTVETDMDKNKLKNILSNLHIEALHATGN